MSYKKALPHHLLIQVDKPARYTGGEFNAPKPKPDAPLQFCMCFPDVYEVAMSNLGIRILQGVLSLRDDTCCERCFTPWHDMADMLKKQNLPLCSLDSGKPLCDFDMIGFSLQYELSYTNVLQMLELGRIPLLAEARGDGLPIVIAGGPCTVNPGPMSRFFDVMVVGDGEEVIDKLAEIYCSLKLGGCKNIKKEFLRQADSVRGVYVPSQNPYGAKHKVVRAVANNLDKSFFPVCPALPSIESIHDRAVLELFRGCTRGCRFCQAGMIYRPVRERSVDTLLSHAEQILDNTGYDELSLSSLSTGDYTRIGELSGRLKEIGIKRKVTMSLPSLRMDNFDPEFVSSERLTSITFAPEAGTQRLRDVINKNVSDKDITDSLISAFSRGYSVVKLYFMTGLPTEQKEDIDGIVEICQRARALYKAHGKKSKPLKLSVSTAVFIPKPFTPFQWEAQDSTDKAFEKQRYLKNSLSKMGVAYSYHDMSQSRLEAAMTRGGAEIGAVVLSAFKSGCVFDGWSEYFDFSKWLNAFEINGLDIESYALPKDIDLDEPWGFVDVGITKKFLLSEREKAYSAAVTPDCRQKCLGCGINRIADCSRSGH